MYVQSLEKDDQIAAPTDAYRGCGYGVFQYQVPPDNPGDEFAHRGIRVGVCAAGYGYHGRKFRITQSGEAASQCGNGKGQCDGRSRIACRHRSGDGE